MTDRMRVLKGIRKCLINTITNFQDTMDILDDLGKVSASANIGSFVVGGYFFKDVDREYRKALIKLDSAERSLQPLVKRFRDGRVNPSHFKDDSAITLLNDIVDFEYQILINLLIERRSRESVWYRLKELSHKIQLVIDLIAET
jgi:hypothetical protein